MGGVNKDSLNVNRVAQISKLGPETWAIWSELSERLETNICIRGHLSVWIFFSPRMWVCKCGFIFQRYDDYLLLHLQHST